MEELQTLTVRFNTNNLANSKVRNRAGFKFSKEWKTVEVTEEEKILIENDKFLIIKKIKTELKTTEEPKNDKEIDNITKGEIIQSLTDLWVDFDPKANKKSLYDLLLSINS